MDIQNKNPNAEGLVFGPVTRLILLVIAIVAAIGPNGLYLYSVIYYPELNQEAMNNPVAQAFMMEAMILLVLFLWYVYAKTRSWARVIFYLALSILGSLAFSLPFFLYRNSRGQSS